MQQRIGAPVKEYGRIQLRAIADRPSEYWVDVLYDEDSNRRLFIGTIGVGESDLDGVVKRLHESLHTHNVSLTELRQGISRATDATEREQLEYHLHVNKEFYQLIAAAVDELEARRDEQKR